MRPSRVPLFGGALWWVYAQTYFKYVRLGFLHPEVSLLQRWSDDFTAKLGFSQFFFVNAVEDRA